MESCHHARSTQPKPQKSRGHAIVEDVEQGKSTQADREGNETSEKLVERVEAIKGIDLVKVGKWIARRHDSYGKLMRWVQNMIAATTPAEKGDWQNKNKYNTWGGAINTLLS